MAGNGGMGSAFVELGDKLHKNINASIGMISGLSDRRRQRKNLERQRGVENKLARDEFDLVKMLKEQEFSQIEDQRSWKRDFRNALARGGV